MAEFRQREWAGSICNCNLIAAAIIGDPAADGDTPIVLLDSSRSRLVIQTPVANLQSLTLATGASVDVQQNTVNLADTNTDSLNVIQNDLLDGQISSSSLAANPNYALGYGAVAVGNATATEIRCDLLGDANLDGTVNTADLLTVLRNYFVTTRQWDQGNFYYPYSSVVNVSDLLAVIRNTDLTMAPPIEPGNGAGIITGGNGSFTVSVTITDDLGNGTATGNATATVANVPTVALNTPSNLTVTLGGNGNTTATLTWTDVNGDGRDSAMQVEEWDQSMPGGSFVFLDPTLSQVTITDNGATGNVESYSASISGLTSNDVYAFRVRAVAPGESDYSGNVTVAVPAALPGDLPPFFSQPAGSLTITNVTEDAGGITVTVSTSDDLSAGFWSFQLSGYPDDGDAYARCIDPFFTGTMFATQTADGYSLSFPQSYLGCPTLVPGTNYQVQMLATETDPNNYQFANSNVYGDFTAPDTAWSAPSNLTVTDNGDGSYTAAYSYTAPSGATSAAVIIFGVQPGGAPVEVGYATAGGSSLTFYANAGLGTVTGQTRFFATADVAQTFADGNSFAGNSTCSNFTAVTPTATIPAAPGNLTAAALPDGSIGLVWDDNSNNETGFIVQEKLDSDNNPADWTQVGNALPADQSWDTVGLLSSAQTTDIRVFADNSAGPSAPAQTAVQLACSIDIYHNGNIVNGLMHFMIGEQISLDAVLIGGGGQLGAVQWTLPSPLLNGYCAGFNESEAAGEILPLTIADLQKAQLAFYFYEAGQYSCTVTTVIGGKTLSDTAYITVEAPTVDSCTANVPLGKNAVAVRNVTDKGQTYENALSFGTAANDGIVDNASVTMPGLRGGKIFFRQFVETEGYALKAGIGNGKLHPPGHGKWLLDSWLYLDGPGNVKEIASGAQGSLAANDEPYVSYRGATQITMDEHYATFLMYQSDSAGSIAVPLGVTAWGWSGTELNNALVPSTGKWYVTPFVPIPFLRFSWLPTWSGVQKPAERWIWEPS